MLGPDDMSGPDDTLDTTVKTTEIIGSSTDLNLSFGDALYLHPNNTGGSPIVTIKLTGTENYKVWSIAMTFALRNHNKLGFIDGTCKKDKKNLALANQWDMCNSVVVTWILNSLSPELFAGAIYAKNAYEMWTDLKDTYDKVDGSAVFNIHKSINSSSQNGTPIVEYYNNLNSLWKQFDVMICLPTCTCDAAKELQKHNQLIKLMQFLMGLDDSYLAIRSNILSRETLPLVKQAFAIISGEESHRNATSHVTTKPTATVFAAKASNNKRRPNNNNNFSKNRGPNLNLTCTNCNKPGHTVDRYYELIGYPAGYVKRNFNAKPTVSNNASADVFAKSTGTDNKTSNSPVSLTSDQLSRLMNLLNDSGVSSANSSMGGLTVGHPNGTQALITKIGDLKINNNITLYDVLVVPEYTVSLLSVHKLARDSKLFVGFDEHNCYFQDLKGNKTVGIGRQCNGLYLFDIEKYCKIISNNCIATCYVSRSMWHQRLGHPADQVLSVLNKTLNLDSQSVPDHLCDTCNEAKQTREPFSLSDHKSTKLGQLIHLDVWGPYKVTSRDGFRYFLTVVDDFSRAIWTYMLKGKDDVYDSIVNFTNMLSNQFETKVKKFRSDNGSEFVNNKLQNFLNEKGILHQTSCVYTPQQNGIVERKHRHLLNVARSLMFQGELPLYLWPECILTTVYLINRTPSSVLSGKSPFYLVYGHDPSLSHLRVFGCLCYATILNNQDKFSSRSERCVFIGYSNSKKGYKLLSLENKSILFSRDVKFYETVFPFKMKNNPQKVVFESGITSDLNHKNFFDNLDPKRPNDEGRVTLNDDGTELTPESQDIVDSEATSMSENTHPEGNVSQETIVSDETDLVGEFNDNTESISEISDLPVNTIRRSTRQTKLPSSLNDFIINGKVKYGVEKVVNYANLNHSSLCFASSLNKSVEPTCYEHVILDSNWIDAMNTEIEALNKNHTWIITDLPANRKPIKCKWIYKIKYKSNGDIERYKARLVAKGFSQREGIDYDETFSHVVKMTTIRCVIALSVKNEWPLFQLDVNNAFLYGDLDEEIYMTIPQGFSDKTNKTKVCKLVKSLYGLKQTPRKWNEKLVGVLKEHGFVQSVNDHSLFTMSRDNKFIALLVYVDDIVITGNCVDEIDQFKTYLKSKFNIKDLGSLKYFLGIEVIKTGKDLCLTQRKYCLELLKEFGLLGCKPSSTPMEPKSVLPHIATDSDPYLDNITGYQQLLGKLIYLTHTRPDISYSVHCLAQHMHSPLKSHLNCALNVLRYLKNAPGKGIKYAHSKNDNTLVGFSDADWAKCIKTRKSVTGYYVFLNNCFISWKSKKLNTLSRSSTEAEYRSMASAACEIIWIQKLLLDLNVKITLPVDLFCDNKSALQLAINHVFHERSKHFEIDVHFIREKIAKGILKTKKICSSDQTADILTKHLPVYQHKKLCEKLEMFDMFSHQIKGECLKFRGLLVIWAFLLRWCLSLIPEVSSDSKMKD
ncbi:putative RNA-directed DNA polymerase [Tanacetum coccineum]|uniref:RNA-directed DNA polymerase n=1 Tax=Tanacetum coccineum TaxID=301880 RepID=A0ABQ5DHK0_9ASTR